MQTGNAGALCGLRRVSADRGGIGMGYIKDQVNSVITAKAGKSRFPAKPASMRWNTKACRCSGGPGKGCLDDKSRVGCQYGDHSACLGGTCQHKCFQPSIVYMWRGSGPPFTVIFR